MMAGMAGIGVATGREGMGPLFTERVGRWEGKEGRLVKGWGW